jgi:hypothetical protein
MSTAATSNAAVRPGFRRAALKALVLICLAPTSMPAFAIEEPRHEVLRALGESVELRRYAPYVVAEVVLQSPAGEAGNQAFPILAGYIFGKNKGERKMAMTAPVTQTAVPMKMAMTAPVTQQPTSAGMRVQFVLPSEVTLASAPEPLDARVRLREEPAATWAVIRYSGTWSQSSFEQQLAMLRSTLTSAGLTPAGEPVWARYNGPMTPWFLRRNEIWLAVP